MKTFKKLISEVAQPKSADEQRFKDKHEIEVFDHPVAFDHQFTGRIEKQPRIADYTDGEDEMVYETSFSDNLPGRRVSAADINKKNKITVATNATSGKKEQRVDVEASSKNDAMNKALGMFKKKGLKPKVDFDGLRIVEESKQMDRMKIVSKSFDSRPPAERENDRLVGSKKASQQSYVERIDGKFYVVDLKEATEADLDPNKKIVVQGVKGMKSTSFTKKFRNMKAFDKWADSDAAGDFEIQYVMNEESLEEAAKVTYKWYSVKDWKDGDKRYDGIDDLHGEMEDKKFGIIKWGADSPRSAHKDYHLAVPVANVKAIRYMDSRAKPVDINESLEEAAKVTYKWYSVKDWKDGDRRYDGIDDLHGEMEDKKFGIIKWGADSPRAAHKDYHLAIPVANVKAIRYMDSNAKTMDMKESAIKRAIGRLTEGFKLEVGAKVSMAKNGKSIYGKVSGAEKVMGEDGVEVTWSDGTKGRFKTSKFASVSMDKNADYKLGESTGAFVIKAAVAKQNKKKKFEMGDKEYPVTIKDKNAKKIMDEAVAKIACLKCDEVSTAAAWKKNGGFCPKCKTSSQGVAESFDMNEAFKAGTMEMNNGDKVKVSKQDAKLLNQMIDDLNPRNKKEMMKVAMLDKNGFEEIVGFAREAL
jgi:hypothetical protein